MQEALLAGSEQPDYYVDVSDYFAKRMQAIRQHKSQVGRTPAREMRKRLRERMAAVGKEPGYKLAEAFRRVEWR